MTAISKLLTIAALSTVLNGQSVPTTSEFSATDLSSTMTEGFGNPNYYIDTFVFSSQFVAPLAYPVNKCVLTSLLTSTYAKYACMPLPTNDGYYILKTISTSSDCSSPSNETRYDATSESAGGFGTFACDGEDSFVTINAACKSASSKYISVVTDVCYRNNADTLSFRWTCGDAQTDGDFDNVALTSYTDTTCTTSTAVYPIAFDSCKAFTSDIYARAISSLSQGSCDNNFDDYTTEEPEDSANRFVVYGVVVISFIVAIIMA